MSGPSPAASGRPLPRRPYRRWDSFGAEEREVFVGREHETRLLYSEIVSSRLVLLYARSGTGKTSLIQAGVVPLLEEAGMATAVVRMGSDPVEAVRQAVRQIVLPTGRGEVPLVELLRTAVEDLGYLRAGASPPRTDPVAIALFLDQFEEFFIQLASDVQEHFIKEIAAVVHANDLPVYLVFSLREDYFVEMDAFRPHIPWIFHNNSNLRLRRFDRDTARRAIVEPAARYGVGYEAALADALLDDLEERDGRIEPIRLQVVCDALWDRVPEVRPPSFVLPLQAYEEAGRASGIERAAFDVVLDRANLSDHAERLRELLRLLITDAGTKNFRDLESILDGLKISRSELDQLLAPLEASRLVRISRKDKHVFYELSHDYLVPQLQRWLAKSAPVENLERSFGDAIARWREGTPVDKATFEILDRHRGLLTLDDEAVAMLAEASLEHVRNSGYWFRRLDHAQRTLAIVRKVLARTTDNAVRKASLELLLETRVQGAGPEIVAIAMAGDAALRKLATDAIAQSQDAKAVAELEKIASTPEPKSTRWKTAAEILGALRLAGLELGSQHELAYATLVTGSLVTTPSRVLGRLMRQQELAMAQRRRRSLFLYPVTLALASARSIFPALAVGFVTGGVCGVLAAVSRNVLSWLLDLLGLKASVSWFPALFDSPFPWSWFLLGGAILVGLPLAATDALRILGKMRRAIAELAKPPASRPPPPSGATPLPQPGLWTPAS